MSGFFFRICFRFICFAVDHTKPKDAQNIVFLRLFSFSRFYIDLLDHSWHFYAQWLSFHLRYLHKRSGNIFSMMHSVFCITHFDINNSAQHIYTGKWSLLRRVIIFICIANYVHSAGDWSFFYKQYHERKTPLSIFHLDRFRFFLIYWFWFLNDFCQICIVFILLHCFHLLFVCYSLFFSFFLFFMLFQAFQLVSSNVFTWFR